jgi:hypothetical protein
MKRTLLVLTFLCCVIAFVSAQSEAIVSNRLNIGQATELDRYKAEMAQSAPSVVDGKTVEFNWFSVWFSSLIEISPGLEAVSISLDTGSIGYLKSISPVSITLNWWEKVLVHWKSSATGWDKDVYNFSFFPQTLGATLSNEAGTFTFGITYIPLQASVNGIQFGCGVEWKVVGVAAFDAKSFSIIFPFHYLISL